MASSFEPPVSRSCYDRATQFDSAASEARSLPPSGREEWTKEVCPCDCTEAYSVAELVVQNTCVRSDKVA